MDQVQFESMVARLERESQASPAAYRIKVALLALSGLGLILLIIGFAWAALLLLAGVVVAAVMTGGGALVLLLKAGKLLILLAVPFWMLIRASFSALFVRLPKPQGIELARADAPALFTAMDAMRRRMHGPRFHHVLITGDMNAAVVQQPLFGLIGFPRNYLILGLPLLESLSADEMLAVVAHEYGHLAGNHGRFSSRIYRLRHTWETIQTASDHWRGWFGRRLQAIVARYAPYFNAYTFVLARANEYEADAASASLIGTRTACAALKRVNLAAAHHDRYMESVYAAVKWDEAPPGDLASRWACLAPSACTVEQAPQWLLRALGRTPHFDDTHPALAQRLAALSVGPDAADELPPPLEGPTAAEAWLGAKALSLRDDVQRRWHDAIAPDWQARHEEIKAQAQRLAELRSLPAPNRDEEIERLRLQAELEPESDNLPALKTFNAAHPDCAVTVYLEGCLLLDLGDAEGLALLERVCELDADATKAVCEKAYGFLNERNDPRAKGYAQRWQQRDAFESERARQMETVDPSHRLAAPELDEEEMEQVRQILRENSRGIRKAWIARRILPVDPGVRTYIVGIELTFRAKLNKQQGRIVDRLAKGQWPVPVFICALYDGYKPLRKQLTALPGAAIDFAA